MVAALPLVLVFGGIKKAASPLSEWLCGKARFETPVLEKKNIYIYLVPLGLYRITSRKRAYENAKGFRSKYID